MRILCAVSELLTRVDPVTIFDVNLVNHWHGVFDPLLLLVSDVDRPVIEEEPPFDGAVKLLIVRTDGEHSLVLQHHVSVRKRHIPTRL